VNSRHWCRASKSAFRKCCRNALRTAYYKFTIGITFGCEFCCYDPGPLDYLSRANKCQQGLLTAGCSISSGRNGSSSSMVGVALKSYAQKLSVLLAVYGAHTCCTLRMFGIVPATFPDDKLATRYGVHDRRANGRGTPAQRTRSLGLGYKLCAAIPVAGQRTHGTTFRALKVAYRVASPGRSLRSTTALLKWL